MKTINRWQESVLPLALTTLTAAVLSVPGTIQATEPVAQIEEIVVFGPGETRQVQTLTASQLEQYPAGTSPLKAVEKLPGMNFQSAGSYGSYEWSTRIVVRGFNQNQLGFTLDVNARGSAGLPYERATIPAERVIVP